MIEQDFDTHNINDFTPQEVEATGASLSDVQLRLMIATQTFRTILGRRVGLLYNGMTTGSHKAPEHPAGLAVDGFLFPDDGPVEISEIVKAALTAGFKGIGIYWNGSRFSFHLDLRPNYSFWSGVKPHKDFTAWTYGSLFFTP